MRWEFMRMAVFCFVLSRLDADAQSTDARVVGRVTDQSSGRSLARVVVEAFRGDAVVARGESDAGGGFACTLVIELRPVRQSSPQNVYRLEFPRRKDRSGRSAITPQTRRREAESGPSRSNPRRTPGRRGANRRSSSGACRERARRASGSRRDDPAESSPEGSPFRTADLEDPDSGVGQRLARPGQKRASRRPGRGALCRARRYEEAPGLR